MSEKPNCRGAILLGSGCGNCYRCVNEAVRLASEAINHRHYACLLAGLVNAGAAQRIKEAGSTVRVGDSLIAHCGGLHSWIATATNYGESWRPNRPNCPDCGRMGNRNGAVIMSKAFYIQVARTGADDVWGTISPAGELAIAIAGEERKHVEANATAALGLMQCSGSVSTSVNDHGIIVTVYRTRPQGIRITSWPTNVPIPTDPSWDRFVDEYLEED